MYLWSSARCPAQFVLLTTAAFMLCQCQQGNLDEFSGNGKNTSDGGAQQTTSPFQGSGAAVATPSDVPVIYPILTYKGNGSGSISSGGSASLSHDFTVTMDAQTLTISTDRFVGSASQANQAVSTWAKTSQFKLAPATTGATTQLCTDSTFLLCALSAIGNNGASLQFSNPLPIFVVPAPSSRFTALQSGQALTYASTASGARSFSIAATVSQIPSGDATTSIRVVYNIPQDTTCELYGIMPFFQSATYSIDPTGKNVTLINATTCSWDSANGVKVTVAIKYELCTRSQSGQVTAFGGCVGTVPK